MVHVKRAHSRRGLTGSHLCRARRQVEEMARLTPAAPGCLRRRLVGCLVEALWAASARPRFGFPAASAAATATAVAAGVSSLPLAVAGSRAVVVGDAWWRQFFALGVPAPCALGEH
jgi:hypothetical protein